MIADIIQAPDERLHRVSDPIKRFAVVGDVFGVLVSTRFARRAAGLSAVQIGQLWRVASFDPTSARGWKIMVNPEVIELRGPAVTRPEGCMSIMFGVPRFDVCRREIAVVRFLDRNGGEHTEMFTGFGARLVQHEIDHMDGRLITDPRVTT